MQAVRQIGVILIAMKRSLIFCLSVVVASLFLSGSANATVNDFIISDYKIDYFLSKDSANRSQLKTTEIITAQFPSIDQNHGIERAIPKKYQGHSTSLKIVSVADQFGKPLEYTTYDRSDNTVLRIGNKDTYVHGAHTYVIVYSQRDVTNYFANLNRDEFYWDTNGTEWAVPISSLQVNVSIDESLHSAILPDPACYYGAFGSAKKCVIATTENGFSVQNTGLRAFENITFSQGFKPGTFSAYQKSTAEKLFIVALIASLIAIPVSIVLVAWIIISSGRISRRVKERGSIITEYLPPKDTSVTTAAGVMQKPKSVFAAQLLDFAVRHYVKIYETKSKGWFRSAEYELEIVKDTSKLKAEEREILSDIFGGDTVVGQRLALKTLKNNTAVYNRMQNNDKQLKALVRGEYGLRERNPSKTKFYRNLGFVLLAMAVFLFIPVLIIPAITSLVIAYTLWPLTDKGLALSQYIEGIKQYIKVAEEDRLKALQSPEGVAKVGSIDVNNGEQLLKLYEKVLPYAVLMGSEKEWNKRIGEYYGTTESSPSWYNSSASSFNPVAFAGAMNSFSSVASYTSASSSSSGGSSGGGSSGGGGGGGGGGGW